MSTESERLKESVLNHVRDMINELKSLEKEFSQTGPCHIFVQTTITGVPMTVAAIQNKNLVLHSSLMQFIEAQRAEAKADEGFYPGA